MHKIKFAAVSRPRKAPLVGLRIVFFGVLIFWGSQQPSRALGYQVGNVPNSKRDHSRPPKQQQQQQQQHVGIFESIEQKESNATKNTILMTPPRPAGNQQIPAHNASRPRPMVSTPTSSRWIGTDQLNHLKETVNIIDVIEAHNLDRFERKGQNRATAVCPFHDDHNPSLSIDSTRGIFKCFACGEGGDVFRFVSQMGRLRGEEMTFYDSVRRVQDEFADGSYSGSNPSVPTTAPVVLTKEQAEHRKRLQERIYQANAAAAAFYSDALTKPMAGGARAYLRQRYVTPATTRMFAIGFAADSYFGPQASRTSREEWGKGSLVEHLRALGFTADELLAAGLVIQTKRAEQQQQLQQQQQENIQDSSSDESNAMSAQTDEPDESVSVSFDVLMDRFRGRIVVPIFDSTGKRVLGFGGRILEETQQPEFEQPKYLNSPESLVFQKKSVLFGLQLAKEEPSSESSKNVVLVEGYMDAVALHSVGVTGVVASMGTAVSPEQLLSASQAASRRGGSLILCMDSDDAGLQAVDRLCLGGMISDVLEKSSIDIRIATLPDGKKDPAEYIEAKLKRGSKKETVETDFKVSTLDKAVPWIDWYIQRILGSHSPSAEPGDDGSLRTIIDRLAEFINICSNQIDRETKASEIAASLSDLIARSGNVTTVSDTVRNQLESDLLQLATSKGLAKEAAKRGGADYNEGKVGSRKNRLTAALARGYGPTSSQTRDKISLAKLNAITPNENELPATLRPSEVRRGETGSRVEPGAKSPRSSFKVKRRQSEPTMPDIIPHFSGFTFESQADAKWLGVDKKGANFVLGLPRKESRFIPKDELYPRSNKPVYFNSNEYHGKQIITDEAIKAGYNSDGVVKDPSIAYKGVAFLVKPNAQKLHASAEDELLTLLVRNGPARLSVKNWLDSRRAVHSEIDLHWTSSAKEWLFSCLVDGMPSIPPGVIEPDEVRSHLAHRDDLPDGALSIVDNTTEIPVDPPISSGTLDHLFVPSTSNGDPTDPKHGDMHAQELLATLVWASTAHFAQLIKAELDETVYALEQLPPAENLTDASLNTTDKVSAPPVSDGNRNTTLIIKSQLEARCAELAQDFWQVQRSLQSLSESTRRVYHRVLEDNKAAWGVNRLSKAAQREFEEAMDEFVLVYSPPPAPPEVEALMDGRDILENEPYEDVLERLDEDWGDWLDDEIGSTSEPVDLPPILSDQFMDYDVDETLEEAIARLDEDWGDWANDD
eukprot:scaffold2120_cov169-Amphora_coffeaeformis.AAC.10